MESLLFGSTLLVSFLGGVVALLAPCCASVMVPAYLATGLRRRGGVLAATLVFSAGVATVVVPIGLGAGALSALVAGQHFVVFALGGLAMAAGGAAVLGGWKPRLPMPGGLAPRPGAQGVGGTYALGVFSGVASSCCAPVLAGMAVLSGATASFPAALLVALVYVAGMVAPLAALALVWDRRGWASSRLLQGKEVTLRLGRLRRRMALGTAASGILLVGMGALTVGLAFAGPGMGADEWQVRVGAGLQHAASVTAGYLSWLPGWGFALLLAGAAVLVARQALRHRAVPPETGADPAPQGVPEPEGPAAAPARQACCAPAQTPDPTIHLDRRDPEGRP